MYPQTFLSNMHWLIFLQGRKEFTVEGIQCVIPSSDEGLSMTEWLEQCNASSDNNLWILKQTQEMGEKMEL